MTPGTPNPKAALIALPLLCATNLTAQTARRPAPQQTVTVVVLNAHAQPAQPVPTVRVSLSYVDTGTRVTEAVKPTSSNGEANLLVSSDAPQRGDLRIEISGVTGLVIYQPADGQLTCPRDQTDQLKCPFMQMTALPSRITIRLLPKGSPLLLGPVQIEALLHRLSVQVNSLQKQNQSLKNQKPDLSAAFAEIAQAYGFAPADFDNQVQQWAQQIQSRADRATNEQQALAELALNHYAAARQLFDKAGDADRNDLDALDNEEQALEQARRTKLRQILTDAQQSARASQLILQYHQATATLESARDRAVAEHGKHRDDLVLSAIWLSSISAASLAREQEAEVADPAQCMALLGHSVDDSQALISQYHALGDAANAANEENNLGNALLAEGERAPGDKSAAYFAQAVAAFQSSLSVNTQQTAPLDWATTQMDLGNALDSEAERLPTGKALALFAQSEEAYRQALLVDTRDTHPEEWGKVQMDLGNTLADEADRAQGEESRALLVRAVAAYEQSLRVRNRTATPQDWAYTQSNLGVALWAEGERSTGEEAIALFEKAAAADNASLEVRTREGAPQLWANSHVNLGNALWDEGDLTPGDKGLALLEQAAAAYRSALEVDTRAELPQAWAKAEANLANVLRDEGEHSSGAKAQDLFAQAVAAYSSVLEVFTRAEFPPYWAIVRKDIGIVHDDMGDFVTAAVDFRAVEEVSPDPDVRLYMMLAELGTSDFTGCMAESAQVPDSALIEDQAQMRRLTRLACEFGAGHKAEALQLEQAMSATAGSFHKGAWSLTGMDLYLKTAPAFAPGRSAWLALFAAYQSGDSHALSTALHQLEPLMQK